MKRRLNCLNRIQHVLIFYTHVLVEKVLRAWTSDGNDEAVVVKAFNDTVFKKSLMTLADGLWLGDEVGLSKRCTFVLFDYFISSLYVDILV